MGLLFKLGQQFTGLGGDKTWYLNLRLKAGAQRETFKKDLKLSAEFEGGNYYVRPKAVVELLIGFF